MKCSIQGCRGQYQSREITHRVHHQGRIVVINHVPAEVCSVCGDVLMKPETVRHVEDLLQGRTGSPPM
jgi:YgiT-type zinc finger domain-containing protein